MSRNDHSAYDTNDPFKNVDHGGAANLGEFPPTVVELHFASRVLRGEQGVDEPGALVTLHALAKSAERAEAIMAHVRRAAEAEKTLSRFGDGS